MGLNRRDQFENHMEVTESSMSGDAECIESFEDNPYDDDFDELCDRADFEGKHLTLESVDLIEQFDTRTAIDEKVKEIPKQPLPKEIAQTFRGANYRTVETNEDMMLYRVYGSGAGKQGCYLTTQVPTDRMKAKITSALPEQWHNSTEYYCKVNVPKGTQLNVGKVGEQKTLANNSLRGGADQILVSPGFAANPSHYGEEYELGYAGNYLEFEKKAKNIENES